MRNYYAGLKWSASLFLEVQAPPCFESSFCVNAMTDTIPTHEQILRIKETALQANNDAQTIEVVEQVRVEYLGKKGQVSGMMKLLGKMTRRNGKPRGQP